jgi:hypothetical protein
VYFKNKNYVLEWIIFIPCIKEHIGMNSVKLIASQAHLVNQFFGAFACLWEGTMSFVLLSVCSSALNNLDPNGRLFMKFEDFSKK